MGSKKTFQCRRVAVVTGSIATALIVCLIVATWSMLSSDNGIEGIGVLLVVGSGCFSALFAVVALSSWYISSYCDPADSHTFASLAAQFAVWKLLSLRGRSAFSSLSAASRDLPTVQTELLLSILRRNASTIFGLKHQFDSIKSRADYTTTVPLATYNDFAEYIEKIINCDTGNRATVDSVRSLSAVPDGECAEKRNNENCTEQQPQVAGVLTADKVEFLACSAGTSGKNKIVPVTSLSKQIAAHFVGPLSFYVAELAVNGGNRPNLQRVLNLSYKAPVGQMSSSGLPVGPISAYIGRRMPYVISPAEVYTDITDEPSALHIHAVFGLAEREIGYMEALFSTLVYSFWKHIEHHWPAICDQIESGRLSWTCDADNHDGVRGCSPSSARSSAILAAIGKRLRPNPERAAELRREFSSAAGFDGIATRVWPRLKAVRMTATGSFAHYARRLSDVHMRGVRQLSLIHAASEGYFGVEIGPAGTPPSTTECATSKVQDELGMKARYAMLPTVGFYEFIPVEDLDAEKPMTLFADQVTQGQTYELVYTSQTGLYRYRTGDIIKIVDFYNQCPIYEFLYRVGQTLNVYWEKTPESVLYDAIWKTVGSFEGVQLVDYTCTEHIFASQVTAKDDAAKHYVLFVEVERDGKDVFLNEQEKAMFDTTLRNSFEMYDIYRANGSIGPMRVYQVARGTFTRLKQLAMSVSLSSLTSSGNFQNSTNPQYKTPRVVRNPTIIELLISSSIEHRLKEDNLG